MTRIPTREFSDWPLDHAKILCHFFTWRKSLTDSKRNMLPLAIFVLTAMLFSATKVNSANCSTSCGNLNIPFPFGTSPDCSFDESFLITCNHSYNPPKPFLNNIEILGISLDGLIRVSSSVASECYNASGTRVHRTISKLTSPNFLISSTQNKFTAVGCDTYALVEGSDPQQKEMVAGCVSWCNSTHSVENGTCSGNGCCQTSMPKGVRGFSVDISSFRNNTRVKSFNPCSYAFVVESEAFKFSSVDLEDLQKRKSVPIVLDWSVGNGTCQEALKNASTYGCRADHSECSHSSNGIGYLCRCSKGFDGNPYLVDGCKDIDDCTTSKGLKGDGKKDGNSCRSKSKINGYTIFYVVSGFMVPAVGTSWIFWRRKEKKVENLRQKLFKRNGGDLLQSMLSKHSKLVVFEAEDLKRATDNYDENRVLYREDSVGVTYYGILPVDIYPVIIQTCNAVEDWDIEVFVRKVVSLSCFHHKNLVRLLGCCLETQVPLVVYEFFNSVTLHGYLHGGSYSIFSLPWDICLGIAAQTAEVLCYMHHGTGTPIIHGNINSYNILLGYDGSVKIHNPVSIRPRGFSDCGMIGYLDPEYFVSCMLTVKSDVYSFGVVLAELLTGGKVIDNARPLQEQVLAKYFVSSLGEDNLVKILDCRLDTEGKMDQITQVAKLALRCLSLSSADRPTMKEVAITLEVAMSENSSPVIVNAKMSHGITTARRVVRRNRSF